MVISNLVLLLLAPMLAAQSPEQKKATVKFVQEMQAPDGGFLASPTGTRGSLRATTTGLRAVKYFGGEAKDRTAAEKFVKGCFDAQTGGFSDQPGGKSDVVSTAAGVMAVGELKLPMKGYASVLS
jgi:prenyltransferase beta subunit